MQANLVGRKVDKFGKMVLKLITVVVILLGQVKQMDVLDG
jgi:hypothetical protein